MANTSYTVDSVAIVLLCVGGLAANLLVWVAGSPQYGILSTLAHEFDLGRLIGFSLVAFVIAALILRRKFRVASSRPYGLLFFGMVSAAPFVCFMAVLVARAIHGR